jgi:hypothetical protein
MDPNANTSHAQYNVRSVPARSRLEKVGFWIIVAASIALLLVLLGIIVPPVLGGLIFGGFTATFVGTLTLMNLPRPSGWANTLLGRSVFPVISTTDSDIWRLAGVNAALVFVFTLMYSVVAHFLGAFFGGLIVFAILIAAGIFYNRARRVVIRP